jgi:hypothetical protein
MYSLRDGIVLLKYIASTYLLLRWSVIYIWAQNHDLYMPALIDQEPE